MSELNSSDGNRVVKLLRRWLGGAVLVLVTLALLLLILLTIWKIPLAAIPALDDADLAKMTPKERTEARAAWLGLVGAYRTTAIQILGGLFVVLGAVLAWLQFYHVRKEARRQEKEKRDDYHLELFDKSLTQLGAASAGLRTGGLQALAKLSELSDTYRQDVAEVLVTFIRDASPWPPEKPRPEIEEEFVADSGPNLRSWSPDVQKALDLMGKHTFLWHKLDMVRLRNLDLRKVTMKGHRQGYLLSESKLYGAWLADADFNGSSFARADLSNAHCGGTNFRGCNLRGTIFKGAIFDDKTTLKDATFDSSTVWPDGWCAEKANSKFAKEVPITAKPTRVEPKDVPVI